MLLLILYGGDEISKDQFSRLGEFQADRPVVFVFTAEGAADWRGLDVAPADPVGGKDGEDSVVFAVEAYGTPSSQASAILRRGTGSHGHESVGDHGDRATRLERFSGRYRINGLRG